MTRSRKVLTEYSIDRMHLDGKQKDHYARLILYILFYIEKKSATTIDAPIRVKPRERKFEIVFMMIHEIPFEI